MKWIVLEENPKPDQYIAVIAADDDRVLKVEMRACSHFKTQTEALLRARQLREIFQVKDIRVFYLEGHSACI